MKIFFRCFVKTLFITGFSAIFISCTEKAAKTAEKSAPLENSNSLSQAFMKAQSSKQSEKTATDRITFNKEIVIKDTKSAKSLQASPDSAFAGPFKMPQDYDLSTNRLILSVHIYTPYSFAMQSPGIREYSDIVKK